MSMLATPQKVSEYAASREAPHPEHRVRERETRLIMTVSSRRPCAGATGPIGGAWARPCLECGASPCLRAHKNGFDCGERPGRRQCGSCILGAILWSAPGQAGRTIRVGGFSRGRDPARRLRLQQRWPNFTKDCPSCARATCTGHAGLLGRGADPRRCGRAGRAHEQVICAALAPRVHAPWTTRRRRRRPRPRQQPTCAIAVGKTPLHGWLTNQHLRPRLPRAAHSGNGKWTHAAVAFKGEDCPARRFARRRPRMSRHSRRSRSGPTRISRRGRRADHGWLASCRGCRPGPRATMQRRVTASSVPAHGSRLAPRRGAIVGVVVFDAWDGVEGRTVADWEWGLTLVSRRAFLLALAPGPAFPPRRRALRRPPPRLGSMSKSRMRRASSRASRSSDAVTRPKPRPGFECNGRSGRRATQLDGAPLPDDAHLLAVGLPGRPGVHARCGRDRRRPGSRPTSR